MEAEGPALSWYMVDYESREVWVVEDIPSAVRLAAQGVNAVAMNGCGVGGDIVTELTDNADRVVWAFDQDATRRAIQHHQRYKFLFTDSTVVPLTKDIKDMKEDELCSLLAES
jgi:hypothetical protein